ncbi:MAG: hypothetical protein GX644_11365 [Limnobacter sp.]|nr:hypothetical protein [Limnobacter sp.]
MTFRAAAPEPVPRLRIGRGLAPRSLAGALALAGLMLAPGVLHAAAGTAQQRYEAERALCLSGLSHQERETCLREAAAARAEAERAAMAQPSPDYLRNALRRCERLPAADRPACEARVRGEGTVRGSVEEGGIYRERRELVPAPVEPPPAPAPGVPAPPPVQSPVPAPPPIQAPGVPVSPPALPPAGAPPSTTLPPGTPPGAQPPARVAPIPPSPATPVVPPPTHAPGSPAPAVTPGVAPPASAPGMPPPAGSPGMPSAPGTQ